MDKNQMNEVEHILGYEFSNKALLRQAYTLRSYAEEQGGECNEILEWIGDAFIYRYMTQKALECFMRVDAQNGLASRYAEGELSKWRQCFLGTPYLSGRVDKLGLANKAYFRMGKGDALQGVHTRPGIKENLLEALVGAIALDCKQDGQTIRQALGVLLAVDNDGSRARQTHLSAGETNYISKVQKFFAKHEHFAFSSWNDHYPQSFIDSGLVGASCKRTQEIYECTQIQDGWRCDALIPEYKYTMYDSIENQSLMGIAGFQMDETVYNQGCYEEQTKFVGCGQNKKEAKVEAARQIWEYVSKRQAAWFDSIGKSGARAGLITTGLSTPEDRELRAIIVRRLEQLHQSSADSAVNALDELYRAGWTNKAEYTTTDVMNVQTLQWQVHCVIAVVHNGKVYRATAKDTQKKEAKKNAALSLLKQLGGLNE
ncbi:MAG: putative dsRNA-binding protein [Firmicutes bacterium]|nr:putative dsRNA-binding protein [Bacillota bacterium]